VAAGTSPPLKASRDMTNKHSRAEQPMLARPLEHLTGTRSTSRKAYQTSVRAWPAGHQLLEPKPGEALRQTCAVDHLLVRVRRARLRTCFCLLPYPWLLRDVDL
jgi:hypothetical protein